MDAPNRLIAAALEIEGIAAKSGRGIDWNDARKDLAQLLELKGDNAALGKLDAVLARHGIR